MQELISPDPHSFANPHTAKVTHLHWTAHIDFETRVIRATAVWQIEHDTSAEVLVLDTKRLHVESVSTNDEETASFTIGKINTLLGSPLTISITPKTHTVTVRYSTDPEAEAMQWLVTRHNDGSETPFLFTQSQAILARSWVPCQDSPGLRFTYSADVTASLPILVLMSASNPQQVNKDGVYRFEMKQPIPSYLLALAAGELVFKPLSERAGIYATTEVIDAAVWEFADLEKMILTAEELYGAYAWERYDLLVLPPSFPFGGMENPRLTFVTPTILAGDRSLTSLVAHELAHSWSGNLVTNATWNDFWLNEGFTVYSETRIMEKLYGREYAEMLMSLNLKDLLDEIETLKADGLWADTKLQLNLAGRNPDDGVTEIAYNKGFFFLYAIEKKVGREKFDGFVTDYFRDHAFQSMTTTQFVLYVTAYFSSRHGIEIAADFLNAWIYTEGLPSDYPKVVSQRFTHIDGVVSSWPEHRGGGIETNGWSTHEWLHFLSHLPPSLRSTDMAALDAFGKFTTSGNAEIIAAWGVIAIRFDYQKAYAAVEDFLIKTGRRKFLLPLYQEILSKPEGLAWARRIYEKARPGYHFVATHTFDKLLKVGG